MQTKRLVDADVDLHGHIQKKISNVSCWFYRLLDHNPEQYKIAIKGFTIAGVMACKNLQMKYAHCSWRVNGKSLINVQVPCC